MSITQGLSFLQERIGKVINDTFSPAGSWLGFTLQSVSQGKAVATLEVRSEMCNPYGNIHGGMMGLVIDEIIGFAVVSLNASNHYTSVNLNIDYLYAIKRGETLRAEGEIIRHGKKIVNAEVRVYNNESNTLLAKASSNLAATNMAIVGNPQQ